MPAQSPNTRLLRHAASGHLDKVREDLAAGAQVNTPHLQHGTPLMRAVRAGHEGVAQALLNAGADPSIELLHVGTPLHALVQDARNNAHRPASLASTQRLLTLLVAHKADVNRHAPNGQTPLLNAMSHGNLDLVQHLLTLGADPNRCALNHQPTSPGQPRQPRFGLSPLVHAMIGNDSAQDRVRLQLVNLLLSAGADVNALDGNGGLPLHSAVSAQTSREVVQRLLDAGADPDCPGLTNRDNLDEVLERRGSLAVKALFESRALRAAMEETDTPVLDRTRPRL